MATDDSETLNLLFDQYSRQEWARRMIEYLRKNNEQFSILDVGGYKGKTAAFHPNDKVIVCDMFDIDEPNYIKGDGRKLPFKDGEFDFTVSFDTLEHIPRADRRRFISELVRVSRKGVVLAAPFNDANGDVAKAERALNQFYYDIYGTEHRWLKEHIEYRIPTEKELEGMVKKMGLLYAKIATNNLDTWQLIQSVYSLIDLDEDLRGRVDDINRFYNSHLQELDVNEGTTYRKIYFIGSEEKVISRIGALNQIYGRMTQNSTKHEFMALVLSIMGKKYRDVEQYKDYLEKEVSRLKNEIALLTIRKSTHRKSFREVTHLSNAALTKRIIHRKHRAKD